MALTAGTLVVAAGAAAVEDADSTDVTAALAGLSPNFAAVSLGGQKLQNFVIQIQNDGGTIKHRFYGHSLGSGDNPNYADKITSPATSATATPTVGAGTGFTSGAGITTNNIVFDTAAQDSATFFGDANVIYYSGNNTNVRAVVGFVSRNVNGTTRVRLEIALFNAMTGDSVNVDTTWLPTGKQVQIRFTGYLA